MKFSEAYDKIIEAYFKDEIRPMDSKFCFCGTLHGSDDWNFVWRGDVPYSYPEYHKMERALFEGIQQVDGYFWHVEGICSGMSEDGLFNGMSAALDVLHKIHESRGEVIEPFEFKKRELVKAL